MRANFRLFHRFALWFAFFLSLCGFSAALTRYYAEDICHREGFPVISLTYKNSVVLKSFGTDISPSCTILVKPERFASVLLSIKSFNLTSGDELIIEDSDFVKLQLLGNREFPDERKTISSDGRITIHFTPDHSNPRWKTNFEFVLTQRHDSPCNSRQFKCSNGRCIDSSLICDGHNHCGDRSDQTSCGRKDDERSRKHEEFIVRRQPAILPIILIAVGSIIAIVFVVTLSILIHRIVKKKKEAGQAGAGASAPTDVATAPPQPPTAGDAPEPHPTYWTRIRNSLRRNPPSAEPNPGSGEHQISDSFHAVPSMYPQITSPTAPQQSGVDNPDFKADE